MAAKFPGRLVWLISCDESGTGGARYYGFGSLWMRWQRRGDFARDIREIRERHGCLDEIKWQKAHSRYNREFYLELIDYFFRRPWLAFHCMIVRKGMVDKSYHGGSYDLARRKHFTKLLANKIDANRRRHRGRDLAYRIWVDPIPSPYAKAHEAIEVIGNNLLGRYGQRPIESVVERDSKETPTIQICDLLLGAVMDAWQGKSASGGKRAIQQELAGYLGWPDLRADTYRHERKFNIWYFHDGKRSREAKTRPVRLRYPLPHQQPGQ